MELRVVQGSILDIESDALVVNLFDGVTSPGGATGAVDSALGGVITELIQSKEISGKLNKAALIHTYGKIAPKRVLVMGLGKSEEFDYVAVSKVAGTSARLLRDKGIKTVTSIVHGAGIGGLDVKEASRGLTEGVILGLYKGDLYKTSDEPSSEIESFTLVEQDESKIGSLEEGMNQGRILGEAVNFARNLGNEPANRMTPSILAEKAVEIAQEYGLEHEVLGLDEMKKLGMGAIISVAQGSAQPPKLILLKYKSGRESDTNLALVGKGLTFDTGGVSLKPHDSMKSMKYDMSGGGAVIGAMKAIAQLKPDINIMAVIPASENMPSGTAYKPDDVITCSNGKTVEIISTDAEGRMLLADAITFAIQKGATHLIDVATLTGSCAIALGSNITGIMTNNNELANSLRESARISGEKVWELPLPPEYMDQLKSEVADIKNCGSRYGGALTAGLFLKEFVQNLPWVHMDIAGTADSDSEEPYRSKGATGVGVRMLALLAMRMK